MQMFGKERGVSAFISCGNALQAAVRVKEGKITMEGNRYCCLPLRPGA